MRWHDVSPHLGRIDEALALSRGTVEIQRRVLGPEHPKTIRSIYNLACMSAEQGDVGQAPSTLREAVAHGFKNESLLLEDLDLAAVREDPEFQEILAATKENAQRAR